MKFLPFRVRPWPVMLLTFLSAALAPAASNLIRQNTKITFDKANFLVFEDVGREDTKTYIRFGQKIVLHATRDGKPVDYDLGKLEYSKTPVSSQVKELRYRDKDRVWIISRLGRRTSGILYNLATRKVDWAAVGAYLALSPDARHLAYAFLYIDPLRIGHQWVCPAVFVNTVMVYPRVEPGFTRRVDFDACKEDGTNPWNLLTREQQLMDLDLEIQWLSNGAIEFKVCPVAPDNMDAGRPPKPARQPSQAIRVSGLEDLKDTRRMTISVVTSGTLKSPPPPASENKR